MGAGDFTAVFEGGDGGVGLVDVQFDFVAHGHLAHVDFDRQGTGVFHGVEEDRGDLAAQANAAEAFVGDEGDVFAGEPEDGVGRRFARGAGANHITDVGDEVAFLCEGGELFERATYAGLVGFDAGTGVLEHGQGMQGDVRAGGGVGGRGEVVGVGLARYLEDGDFLDGGDFRARGEPFGVGPGLQDRPGVAAALVGEGLHVMEVVEDEQGLFEAGGGDRADLGVGEQVDQRFDVVAAEHGAEEFGGFLAGDEGAGLLASSDFSEEGGFDLGSVVNPGRDALAQEFDQRRAFAGRRGLQQRDEFGGLSGRQRQGRNAQSSALGNMGAVGFQHGRVLSGWSCLHEARNSRRQRKMEKALCVAWHLFRFFAFLGYLQ